ncbi:XRE family transcriptional regulator [Gordonia pseudamarae]|uniref:XRE family transcriptional regulator n=1 Tax=Gordonia pseudamarae TaxID=2831662 RepID=A0ABX6IMM6_9ACTN|nr:MULTISPECIES: XRE family transcriptional regulator [Gordonia]QHN28313.1 XRE family transcriptional regulator [Gordonia pseudamarae]QHN37182.1 XRE family transcriptional regulator [Gordonia pseudamarae]
MSSRGTEKPEGAAARRYDGTAEPARPRQDVVDPGLFARRLEELFRTVPGPNGRAYSAKAIAARSTERGFRLGESYLSQLRSGKAKSPSFRTVEGIAAAFGVDVHYFLEDRAAQRTRDEIDLMRLQADTNVQLAAFRLAGLSSDSVTVVNELIKVLREQQGLPKDPPDLLSTGAQDQISDAQRLRVVGGQQSQD